MNCRDNDCIEHDAVRIENPIYNAELEIVFEDKDYCVINKPPSVPVKSSNNLILLLNLLGSCLRKLFF